MAVVTSPNRPNLADLELGMPIAPATWETVVALQNHVAADSQITLATWRANNDALTIPAGTAATTVVTMAVRVPAAVDEVTLTSWGAHCEIIVDGTTLTHAGAASVQTATHSVSPDSDWVFAIAVSSTPGGEAYAVQIRYSVVAVP